MPFTPFGAGSHYVAPQKWSYKYMVECMLAYKTRILTRSQCDAIAKKQSKHKSKEMFREELFL